MNLNVLGLIYNCNNPSAALIKNGEIDSIIEEERFIREKHAHNKFPINSIKYCLEHGNLKMSDIDIIAIGWDVSKYPGFINDFNNNLIRENYPLSKPSLNWLDKDKNRFNKENLEEQLFLFFPELKDGNTKTKISYISHHLSHASSAFFTSGFEESCIITSDGHGEEDAICIWKAEKNKLEKIYQWDIPQSLGWFYTKFTTWFGFDAHDGEGKLMGLAAYGSDDIELDKKLDNICNLTGKNNVFELNPRIFYDNILENGYTQEWTELFGEPFDKNIEFKKYHFNLAYAVQKRLEDAMTKIAEKALKLTNSKKLCTAGGTFMNCKLNGKLSEMVGTNNYFVQPLSADNGCSLGAALYVYNKESDKIYNKKLEHLYLGTEYSNTEIENELKVSGLKYFKSEDISKDAAKLLSESKVIGWFEGRMEAGARALGSRSILGNSVNKDMQNIINVKVKFREPWRPFCPAVLKEDLEKYFKASGDFPFMIVSTGVKEEHIKEIPSVVHYDKTVRVQTVTNKNNLKYYNLINEFKKITGCSVILNTSFNLKGEPIVNTPKEAITCFLKSGMDVLVIGDYIINK